VGGVTLKLRRKRLLRRLISLDGEPRIPRVGKDGRRMDQMRIVDYSSRELRMR
jgi:hypothetical protein